MSDAPVALDAAAVTVRAGESLDQLSRWSAASVEEIAAQNGLEITAPLVPGQVLRIPMADREAFEASRSGALESRLERYLAANGGLAGIEGYTVRTGDTAWAIAKHVAGVPACMGGRRARVAAWTRMDRRVGSGPFFLCPFKKTKEADLCV